MSHPSSEFVDLLILGAGWTSTFLIPLLTSSNPSFAFAATTTSGRTLPSGHPSIAFNFLSGSSDLAPYAPLPAAKTVLITFPLTGTTQSRTLVSNYLAAKPEAAQKGVHWIQLGSTGTWPSSEEGWVDENTPFDKTNERAVAEQELLNLCHDYSTSTKEEAGEACILNLAGLWGGARDPRNWVVRVAKTKEDVKGKKIVHLVHGSNVARAIAACLEREKWEKLKGKRWIVMDLRVNDWWNLIMAWGGGGEEGEGQYRQWVRESMVEEGVRGLPREVGSLGRRLDGRGFWAAVEMEPRRCVLIEGKGKV
ncbi:MAG: hypothetical protein LQ342_002449 [Letrouitia transgressa]|nr:MAG: hypothetical protein LQ342_002449 [Letrouitia transgressa]